MKVSWQFGCVYARSLRTTVFNTSLYIIIDTVCYIELYCAYVMHVDANINLGKVPYFQIRPNSEKMDEKVNGSAQTALNLVDCLLNYIPVLAL